MDKGKNEIITVKVEGAGRLYKRILKNTSKMFYMKYTVLVRFIYYTQKTKKQKTKQNKKTQNSNQEEQVCWLHNMLFITVHKVESVSDQCSLNTQRNDTSVNSER